MNNHAARPDVIGPKDSEEPVLIGPKAEQLFKLRPDGTVHSFHPSLEPLVRALGTQQPAGEARVNALLAALQQQRDTALNQLVITSADLALANEKLKTQGAAGGPPDPINTH